MKYINQKMTGLSNNRGRHKSDKVNNREEVVHVYREQNNGF